MSKDFPSGGAFLLEQVCSRSIFTPEDFTDEQKMFQKTALDFMNNEVLEVSDKIEEKQEGLIRELLQKAGELGLLMVDIPEKYDGLGLDKVTSMLCAESMASQGSFATSLGAHTGIGTLPIVYFGTDEQKKKYLPKLATGELIAAYALTEAGSGSDALAAKTKAVLTEDKQHYILNGSKMWITNGSIADVYVVFAKIDGEHFTGFIVDRDTPGFSVGAEEHKMGIRGSSTTALTFEDAKIPAENVLGEIGKGHRIAFNILNIGRLKLGLVILGAAKSVMEESIRYGKERKQFGKALTEFGLIQKKIAEMAIKTYTAETMGFRTAGLIDEMVAGLDKSDPEYDQKVIKAVEEYNIEASIIKVYGSEKASEVADEGVQIHGGYGFSQEYAVERIYRDARINRIFEGTNEVNRMLIPGTIIKRSMQQRLNLVPAFQNVEKVLKDPAQMPSFDGFLGPQKQLAEAAKLATLYVFNHAFMKYMVKLADQQEILADLSDLIMECYAMDSVLARAEKSGKQDGVMIDMTLVSVSESYYKVLSRAKSMIDDFSTEKEAADRIALLNNLPEAPYLSLLETKRRIANYFIDVERFDF